MPQRLFGIVLIAIGVMLIWYSDQTVRGIVTMKRAPSWMSIPLRIVYILMGAFGIIGGLRILFFGPA